MVTRMGRGVGRTEKVKGIKYMVKEGDYTLGVEHTMAYAGVLL